MAQAFTGTATGNVYVAGRIYERGGDQYRANSDGTFTNMRTGRSSVGSSVQVEAADRERVRREVEAIMQAALRGYEAGKATSGPGVVQTGGARSGGAGSHGAGAPVGGGPGNTGVKLVSSSGAFGNVLTIPGPYEVKLQESNRTPIMIGGQFITMDAGFSDAGDFEERYGDSEILSTGYGLVLLAADARAHFGAQAARDETEARRLRAQLKLPGTELANPYPDAWPPPPSDVFVLSGPAHQNQLSPGPNGEWVGRGLY